MIHPALIYLTALFATVIPDAVWLSIAGSRLYRPALGDLLAPNFSAVPAVAFYLIYAVGVSVFSAGETLAASTARGALFGFCAYATYDLSSQATLRRWPTYLTLTDMAWGTLLTAFAALVTAYVRGRLES